jgi:hypothetical protein
VSAETKLAQIAVALDKAGLPALVMGGHAVRYYGVGRNTNDFDFYVSAASVDEVRERLAQAEIPAEFPPREGPSWRHGDFTRFEIGRLPDGREEWLEFWLHNHLLPEFAETWSHQERGTYGGRELGFLSLEDLIRSKETEREDDWADVALLEEIWDARHLAHVQTPSDQVLVLSSLRSRRGFERALTLGLLRDDAILRQSLPVCQHPVSFAFLVSFVKDAELAAGLPVRIDEAYLAPLRKVEPGSVKHVALVEVVRRSYKRWAMEADRRDKASRSQPEVP